MRSLAADPARPQRLYAGTQGDGVFVSEDGGSSWTSAGLTGEIVKALAVDRNSSVLAATKPPALFASEDGGASWTELPALRRMRRWYWWQPAERPHTSFVTAIAVSPTQPETLLVGIEAQRILYSEDRGQSWTRTRKGTALDAHALAFHAVDGDRAYEGAGLGVATSSDGGRTWTRANAGLAARYVMTIAVDPADPDLWYAGAARMRTAHTANSHACILRRHGATWTLLTGCRPSSSTCRTRSCARRQTLSTPGFATARSGARSTAAMPGAGYPSTFTACVRCLSSTSRLPRRLAVRRLRVQPPRAADDHVCAGSGCVSVGGGVSERQAPFVCAEHLLGCRLPR